MNLIDKYEMFLEELPDRMHSSIPTKFGEYLGTVNTVLYHIYRPFIIMALIHETKLELKAQHIAFFSATEFLYNYLVNYPYYFLHNIKTIISFFKYCHLSIKPYFSLMVISYYARGIFEYVETIFLDPLLLDIVSSLIVFSFICLFLATYQLNIDPDSLHKSKPSVDNAKIDSLPSNSSTETVTPTPKKFLWNIPKKAFTTNSPAKISERHEPPTNNFSTPLAAPTTPPPNSNRVIITPTKTPPPQTDNPQTRVNIISNIPPKTPTLNVQNLAKNDRISIVTDIDQTDNEGRVLEEKEDSQTGQSYADSQDFYSDESSELEYEESGGEEEEDDIHPPITLVESDVLLQSTRDPAVLVGWRVLVKGYGTGVVLSIKPVKFSTTLFVVQLDDQNEPVELALKRSEKKGKIPFSLITRVN